MKTVVQYAEHSSPATEYYTTQSLLSGRICNAMRSMRCQSGELKKTSDAVITVQLEFFQAMPV